MKFSDSDTRPDFYFRKRWTLQWEYTLGHSSMYFSSGRALPYPRAVYFDNLWYGLLQKVGERRIANADVSVGPPGSVGWTDSADKVAWWTPGDIIFNRNYLERWPISWHSTKRGGIALAFSSWRATWEANMRCHLGETVEVEVDGSRYFYRATVYCESGDSQPIWPVLIRDDPISHIKDRYPQVWEWFGTAPSSLSEQFPSIFEPILDCAQIMLVKDCNQLPPPGDPLSEDDTTHARYKFIGTRSDDFSVIINAGLSGSWDRVVSNTTNRTATIRANPGDPSIPIPSNNAYRLLDVSFCVVFVSYNINTIFLQIFIFQ
jgi:hypothetical protein